MLHTVSLKENHVFRRLYHRGATAGNRLLVVYCLREVDLLSAAHGIPEAAGILLTGGVYLWRRDMLSAVLAGTAFYMVLVNLVFA